MQRSGALVRSILADWSPTEAVAGTNLVYAAIHQFGGKIEKQARSQTLAFRVHVAVMPARPFLGVSGEDNRFIIDTLIRHIDPR